MTAREPLLHEIRAEEGEFHQAADVSVGDLLAPGNLDDRCRLPCGELLKLGMTARDRLEQRRVRQSRGGGPAGHDQPCRPLLACEARRNGQDRIERSVRPAAE